MADSEKGKELLAKAEAAGAKVREAKASKAGKEEITALVEALLATKKEYTDVTGEPFPGSKPQKEKAKGEPQSTGGAAAGEGKRAQKKKAKKEAKERARAEKEKAAAAAAASAPAKPAKGKSAKPKKEAKKGDGAPQEGFSFPRTEDEILKYWEEIDAFHSSVKFSEGRPEYTFVDGPPFATGQPHHGHILAGTIKDVVTRYAHQTGHFVERRFGFDCHGLPVEFEIDKTHNITSPQQVAEMGIDKYNAECRKIVMRYAADWKATVKRLGRWIDMENDYRTMYPWFMETVWWVFKQMFDKDLVYYGHKVMPFSTALSTPLSNFEANQEMKDVKDPAVTVSFPVNGEDASFLAWTTTPWTLPSNLALCVHPDLEYTKFKDTKRDGVFYAATARLFSDGGLYKRGSKDVEVISTCLGKDLVGKTYKPIFPYFEDEFSERAFRVISDTYVTSDSGTGIVHNAPGHGEDDFRVCEREGVITAENVPCPVDDSGRYLERVSDYQGVYVKDADKQIIRDVKAKGRLFHRADIVHAYAHCWRSSTPLIRKTVGTWFIRVERIKDKLVANNLQTYWVPNAIKVGKFNNWLTDARDWAVSRNRYWGTPIPLWTSDDGEEVVCVGSVKELEELTGKTGITDLHRESIDDLTIPSKKGKGDLKRVKQVFDCWFESGSVPYAQKHYPFENKERFEKSFPADFIAEGVDQTRGWFYTLLVIGTALFGVSPWKNLIVNGLVLASDGKKMSKRLKNYPDPNLVLREEGADALRLYLITSPAVRAENLRFQRKGVQAIRKDVFLPWLNALRFFEQQAQRLSDVSGEKFTFDALGTCPTTNKMDLWILAYTQSLLSFFHKEMLAYRLYTVVPRLLKYVDNLTNWYIRFNRARLKGRGNGGDEEAALAVWTLGEVLLSLTKLMSPCAPFFSEWVYQQLRPYLRKPSGPDAGAIAQWSSKQVEQFLADSGLEQYLPAFASNGIVGKDLLDLTHDDLSSMGLKKCHDRKAVLRAVRHLSTSQPFDAAAASAPRTITVNGREVSEEDSVHFQMLPKPKTQLLDENIVRAFDNLKRAVEAGRILRDRHTLPVKYPLAELVVISKTEVVLTDIESLAGYMVNELNVQTVSVSSDEAAYNFKLDGTPNADTLGRRLRGEFKKVSTAIRALSSEQLEAFQASGKIVVEGHELGPEDINLTYAVLPDSTSDYTPFTDGDMLVLLHVNPSAELVDQGIAREFVNRVQRLRKTAALQPTDSVTVHFKVLTEAATTKLDTILAVHKDYLLDQLGSEAVAGAPASPDKALVTEENEIKDVGFQLWLLPAVSA